jgi:hypothetical protein
MGSALMPTARNAAIGAPAHPLEEDLELLALAVEKEDAIGDAVIDRAGDRHTFSSSQRRKALSRHSPDDSRN